MSKGINLLELVSQEGLKAKSLSKDGRFIHWSDNTLTSMERFREYVAQGAVAIDKDSQIVTAGEGFRSFANSNGVRSWTDTPEFNAGSIEWDE